MSKRQAGMLLIYLFPNGAGAPVIARVASSSVVCPAAGFRLVLDACCRGVWRTKTKISGSAQRFDLAVAWCLREMQPRPLCITCFRLRCRSCIIECDFGVAVPAQYWKNCLHSAERPVPPLFHLASKCLARKPDLRPGSTIA